MAKYQKRKYLVPAASGQIIFSYALTEPKIGSDVKHIETTVVLDDSGKFCILNGQKSYITKTRHAGGLTVFAQLNPQHPGLLGAFIVETAWDTLYDALQVAGGSGYLSTNPYEKRMRDFRVTTIFEGTTEIHSMYPALYFMRDISRQHKQMASKKFPFLIFLPRITYLSLYLFAIVSMLARVDAARRGGDRIKEDLKLLELFLEQARQVKRNFRLLPSREECLNDDSMPLIIPEEQYDANEISLRFKLSAVTAIKAELKK